MTLVRFIGDTHGKWKRYKKLIKSAPEGVSLQLGDFGVGFYEPYSEPPRLIGGAPPYDTMASGSHYFIRGNHDNPGVCAKHPFWVRDGMYADLMGAEGQVFCIGGATSIDREWRAPGYTWWEDEELSYKNWNIILDLYEQAKPDIVATHDVPERVVRAIIAPRARYTHFYKSMTCQALDNLFEIHRPAVYLHGHHHISYRQVYRGTEFIGLGELDYIDLEL
jgi:predicted phosphodiesterase